MVPYLTDHSAFDAHMLLVLDLYTVDVLRHLHPFCRHLPQLRGRQQVRCVVTASLKQAYADTERMDDGAFFIRCIESRRAFNAAKLENSYHRNTIMLRPTLLRDYESKGLTLKKEDAWIFSMWSGYLEGDGYRAVRERFDALGARFEQIHTSGHASEDDLIRFASSVDPVAVIPIHGKEGHRGVDRFGRVNRLADGEPLPVGWTAPCGV